MMQESFRLNRGALTFRVERLGRTEAILCENSSNCCFKRGYNWVFEEGIWSITACTVWKTFRSWADGLRAATLSLPTLASIYCATARFSSCTMTKAPLAVCMSKYLMR